MPVTAKPVTIVQVIDWIKQGEEEAVCWIETNSTPTLKEVDAYRAGFRQGATQLRNTLSLHGHLVLTDPPERGRTPRRDGLTPECGVCRETIWPNGRCGCHTETTR